MIKHITSKFIQCIYNGQQLCASAELFRCVCVNAKDSLDVMCIS